MDHHNQPPLKPSKTSPIKIILLIIIIFVIIVIAGVIFVIFYFTPIKSISIDPGHQTCQVDNDCTTVFTKCSCDCGSPVNKAYLEKYKQQRDKACKNYNGVRCSMICDYETKCANNKCTMVEKTDNVNTNAVNNANLNTNTALNTNIATNASTPESCEAQSGNWDYHGPYPTKYCNLPTSDGGKKCNNNNECEVEICIANLTLFEEEIVDQGGTIQKIGTCPAWQDTFGCYYIVANGEIDGGELCLD